MRTTKAEHGYTMIEATIYIGFLILLGGWLASMAHSVMLRYKTGRTTQQIIDLKKAVLQFTSAAEDYSELTVYAMVQGSAIPADMRTGDDHKAKHALNGAVKLGAVSNIPGIASSEDNKYMFYITFENLSRKACVEILTQGQFYGNGSDLDTLIINSNKAWRFQHSKYPQNNLSVTTFSPTSSIHLTVNEAINACSDKNNNTITWIFS